MKYHYKKVYIGSDGQGYGAKRELFEFFRNHDELTIVDLGIFDIEEQVECDVLARELGEKVIQNEDSIGILLSYSNEATKMHQAVSDMEGIRPVMACVPDDLKDAEFDLGDVNLLTIPCENEDVETLRNLVFSVMKAKK
jgi:ribose 5-phosphate isomerase RpiB